MLLMRALCKSCFLSSSFVFIVVIFICSGCKESGEKKLKATVPLELSLNPAVLSTMERSSVEVQEKKDTGTRRYEGVAVWRLLDKAGVSSGKLKHKQIAKRYLVARGADGFEVVFSLAELDTAFSSKVVILADKMNGKDLPADRGPYQLIVQDDLRPTRNCYQIIKLVVYEANPENN